MGSLGPTGDPELAADLQDIAIFAAALRVKVSAADPGSAAAGRREALRLLDEAEAAFGPSAVLEHERRVKLAASGLVETSPPRPPPPAPRTAWEHYALGRALLASGDPPQAERELAAAVRLDPAGRWPNFYYGVCACRDGRYEDAVAAFSVCIGTAPDVAGWFHNRALAYDALGRTEQAGRDYDRALRIDPTHAAARLNRGALHLRQGRIDVASADLRLALEHGADAATVHYDLALAHAAAGDPAAALDDVRRALERDPTHEPARQLRDALRRDAAAGPEAGR